MSKKLTVGQLAKKGNVSPRTIQYYDSIGLLKPSEVTQSGRRLYEESDIAVLHQIITLKSFGLPLKEVREKISPIKNEEDILKLLSKQAIIIEERIAMEKKVLESIKMLVKDIGDSNAINWSKYAQILTLISDNNESYWVLKFLDEDILTKMTEVNAQEEDVLSTKWLKNLLEQAKCLKDMDIDPESEKGQELASKWWTFVEKYTGGNPELVDKLLKFYSTAADWPKEIRDIHEEVNEYLESCIDIFLRDNKIDIKKK